MHMNPIRDVDVCKPILILEETVQNLFTSALSKFLRAANSTLILMISGYAGTHFICYIFR